ncbi:MAG: protein MauE [Desulfobacterium sp.]|nr:protein MauE [Desulfobacterium sp.]
MVIRPGKKRSIPLNSIGTILIHNQKIQVVFRFILGITFMAASFHKIIDPGQFAQIIYGYGLFPENLINLIAIIVPFFELFCGLLLIMGVWKGGACLVINMMLVGFIAAISINLIRGYEFDCGCFSGSSSSQFFNPITLLFRDIILLCFGFTVFLSDIQKKSR